MNTTFPPTFERIANEAKTTYTAGQKTKEDAEQLAGWFPKWLRVKASWIGGDAGAMHWFAGIEIITRHNGQTGVANEAGAKREAAFVRACMKLGCRVS